MRRLSLIGGASAIALVGLVAACGSDPVSRVPFSPAAPGISGLQITGPASIPPGQSAQFTAQMRLSDGTVKSSASGLDVRWRTNSGGLLVNSSGVVTAGQNRGDAVLTAELVTNPSIRGTREVIILPDGTYRVVGSVREAEAPTQAVVGALVQVTGTLVSATSDGAGNYRLYGVPPNAELRVTANGYLPAAQNVQLTAHATQNFTLALSGPRVSLNGAFTLTVAVAGGCSSNPALSSSLHLRTYDATVTTTGSLVNVQLTESSRFRATAGRGDRFSGRADAAGVTFTLDSFYYYYYLTYPSVAERLGDNTYVVPYGTASTSQTSSGVAGPVSNGALVHYDSAFPGFNTRYLGSCSSFWLTLARR